MSTSTARARHALGVISRSLRDADPLEIVRYAVRTYDRLALACSFGGPGGMVLLDMLSRVTRDVPVYVLDTGLLFAETYDVMERVRSRYGIDPIAVQPELSVSAQAVARGDELWLRDPDACCALRKVEPARAFLAGRDAWISGIRSEQTASRRDTEAIAWDELFGLIKVSPLVGWDEGKVWAYVRAHDVPYNPLNARGFPSVGCTPCTRAVAAGGAPRDGRWPGFAKTECGLHVPAERSRA